MSVKTEIDQWIDKNEAFHIDFLQEVVRFDSVQGNEANLQDKIASFLEEINLDVDQWYLDSERLESHPYFYSNRNNFDKSPNVVGILKGSGGGKSLLLNGHVDVVPEGDWDQWKYEPYSGKVIDGYMYGRGVTDMKGGNASLLIALHAIQALNIKLKGDVIFQSVVEEESGGAGTLDALLKGYTADAAIIPEPSNMKIFPKQQGSKWFRIVITGKTAHGGTRYHGVSAIDKAYTVIKHLEHLEVARNKRVTDPLYKNSSIPLPINIGKIKGGDWPSSVPDVVEIEGRIGISPDETMEEVLKELEQWLTSLAEIDPWFIDVPVDLEWFGARWLPGKIDNNHELMSVLTNNYKDILHTAPIVEAAPWGTDGGLMTQVSGIPCVVFGPGITNLAHHPNEAILLDDVFKAAKIIAATIVDWCEISK